MNKYNRIICILFILYFFISPASATFQVIASDTIRNTSLPNPNSANPAVYTTINTLAMGDISGTINVSFDCQGIDGGGGGTGKCRLYSNSSAVGAEYDLTGSYVTHVETFSTTQFPDGIMYLKGYVDTESDDSISIQNFQLMYDYTFDSTITEGGIGYDWNNNAYSQNYTFPYSINNVLRGSSIFIDDFSTDTSSSYTQYTTTTETPTFSVSGGTLIQPNTSIAIRKIVLNNYNYTDADLWIRYKRQDTTFGSAFGSVWRFADDINMYRFFHYHNDDKLYTQIMLSGGLTTLNSSQSSTFVNDTYYDSRTNFNGSIFRSKEWVASSSEPTSWNNSGTNTTFTNGSIGFLALSSAKVDFILIRPVDSSGNLITKSNYTFIIKDFGAGTTPQAIRNIVSLYQGNLSVYINTSPDNISWSGNHLLAQNVSNNTWYIFNESDQVRYVQTTLEFDGQEYNVNLYTQLDYGVSVQKSVTITSPSEYFISQRNETNYSTINITGTYISNNSIESIDARFNNSDWITINSSASDNIFSGNISAYTGQGNLEVRLTNGTNITDSVSNVSVGDIFVIAGQSNALGQGDNYSSLNSSNIYYGVAYNNSNSQWGVGNDPFGVSMLGSPYPLLADYLIQNHSIPIGFIQTSLGATNITSWQKGSSSYTQMSNNISTATNGTNSFKGILFLQGESDASPGLGLDGDYTKYKNNLTAFASNIKADYNTSVIVGQIGSFNNSGITTNRTYLDNIRKAQSDSWTDENITEGITTYDIPMSVDNLHFKTDAELLNLSNRWYAVLNATFYGGAESISPKLINASIISLNTIELYFNESSLPLQNGTGGWRIYNGSSILNDSNISSIIIDLNKVQLTLDQNIYSGNISLGSFQDGMGVNVLKDSNGLPATPFSNISITDSYISSLTNASTSTGNFWINNTWTNPIDIDFNGTMWKYENGTEVISNQSNTTTFLNLTWSPNYIQNISAQTFDIYGNINTTLVWFNATVPSATPTATPTGNIPLDTAFPVWVVMMPFLMVMIVYVLIKGFGQMSIWEYVVAALIIGVAVVFLIDNI